MLVFNNQISLLSSIWLSLYFLVSIVQKSTLKANPVTCEICEMAMQYLDSMLSNNSTEDEIRKGLDQLCGYLPESVRGEVYNVFLITNPSCSELDLVKL